MTPQITLRFFRWWVEQLADLIPASWLNMLAKSSDAAILEIDDRRRFVLWVRRDGTMARVTDGALVELRRALESVTGLPRLLLLRVAPETALCKTLSLPGAARRNLKTILGFEIDRETPFEQAEVYWNYAVAAQDERRGKLDLDLVILPRHLTDAAITTVREAGFDAAALEVDTAPDRSVLIWTTAERPIRRILPYEKLIPLGMVTGGLAAAFVVLSFAGQQYNLFIANRTIENLAPSAREASILQQSASHRLAAITFFSRTQGGSALAILTAATRTIPDDTYLTSLAVHDRWITISGYSGSAAGLIGLLAKSPSFHEPAFDSAVTESDNDNREKFTVSATLASLDSL
jgi:general secretion pathway protein L